MRHYRSVSRFSSQVERSRRRRHLFCAHSHCHLFRALLSIPSKLHFTAWQDDEDGLAGAAEDLSLEGSKKKSKRGGKGKAQQKKAVVDPSKQKVLVTFVLKGKKHITHVLGVDTFTLKVRLSLLCTLCRTPVCAEACMACSAILLHYTACLFFFSSGYHGSSFLQ